jgi:hypothetical protein
MPHLQSPLQVHKELLVLQRRCCLDRGKELRLLHLLLEQQLSGKLYLALQQGSRSQESMQPDEPFGLLPFLLSQMRKFKSCPKGIACGVRPALHLHSGSKQQKGSPQQRRIGIEPIAAPVSLHSDSHPMLLEVEEPRQRGSQRCRERKPAGIGSLTVSLRCRKLRGAGKLKPIAVYEGAPSKLCTPILSQSPVQEQLSRARQAQCVRERRDWERAEQ